jgi:CxxC motif-containing protein (DUF1111 family)
MQARRLAIFVGTLLAWSCAKGGSQAETLTSSPQPQSGTPDPVDPGGSTTPDPVDGGSSLPSDAGSGPPVNAAAFGDPLPGLAAAELALFEEGKDHFQDEETVADGIGPVFNEASCVACHRGPEVGGTNGRLETRFGRRGKDGGFDPLANEGGSLLQDHGIGDADGFFYGPEVVPQDANVVAQRRTTSLFGLGLVDATPDEKFHELVKRQAREAPEVTGLAPLVADLVKGGTSVGKFGWKGQNPSLFQFSADAYLNEMGITSPLFPDENCPQGRCADLTHNPLAILNDADGADVARFANFMLFLGAPPRGPENEQTRAGERVFASIGCAICHTPSLVTGPNAVKALDRVEYAPYSDFLLHDMGSLGDGIEQGGASGKHMRTAPLWGLRAATSLLHDGRAETPEEAIDAHDGQARHARFRFDALDHKDRQALLSFLGSL